MVTKPLPGSPLVRSPIVSAGFVADLVDVVAWYKRTIAGGVGVAPDRERLSRSVIQVRNDSAGDLASGAVVEIGTGLLTDLDPAHLWFSGAARSGADPVCGVLLDPIVDGEIGPVCVSGVCLASVDIIDADNTHARVVPSSTQLRGDFGGYARILYKPSGTGVKDCVVLLGHHQSIIRKAVSTSTITANGSGTANVEINGSVVGSVTVYYDHMTGGGNIASSSDLFIQYYHDQDKWIVIGAECGA